MVTVSKSRVTKSDLQWRSRMRRFCCEIRRHENMRHENKFGCGKPRVWSGMAAEGVTGKGKVYVAFHPRLT